MLSVTEAQERIQSGIKSLETTMVALGQALGRVLAEDILSGIDLPPFDNSSVDGFALHAADLPRSTTGGEVTLRVVADIPAGSSQKVVLSAGEAARIMTGAPIPPGAEAVIMVEDTDFAHQTAGSSAPKKVTLTAVVRPGDYIRRRGSDIKTGQKILSAGQKLRPQDLGLLAMLGVAHVPVHKRPKVAMISSGDELVPVESPLGPGQIHDSNSYMLAGLLEADGCDVLKLGVAEDTYESVKAILEKAASTKPDLILSSAGVSVGAHDFIKDAIESDGSLNFWKVNMRPGKPLAYGTYRGLPFFGLPGNPVSSFVSFLLFVQPVLGILSGEATPVQRRVKVTLQEAVESDGRESYLRALVTHVEGRDFARLAGHQGSGNLFSLVEANALLIIPSGVKSCAPGSEAEAWILENY